VAANAARGSVQVNGDLHPSQFDLDGTEPASAEGSDLSSGTIRAIRARTGLEEEFRPLVADSVPTTMRSRGMSTVRFGDFELGRSESSLQRAKAWHLVRRGDGRISRRPSLHRPGQRKSRALRAHWDVPEPSGTLRGVRGSGRTHSPH